jgi:hydroxymethylpyrimidine pyrophosphatase-like HAD family hydrolase
VVPQGAHAVFEAQQSAAAGSGITDACPPQKSPEPEVFQDCPLHRRLEEFLAPLKIIRATSPIDGLSTWVEIFPAGVSKGSAAEWIALREGLGGANALALGNDYNDLDLLDWASHRYVVANAPASLKESYPSVGHHEESAFTEAVAKWRAGPQAP